MKSGKAAVMATMIGLSLAMPAARGAEKGDVGLAETVEERTGQKGGSGPDVTVVERRQRMGEIALPADQLDRMERANVPDDVKRLISEFKDARQDFLGKRGDLIKQLRGASKEDRDKIRELLKDLRRDFVENQKDLRTQILQRVQELKERLPDHKEVIDSAKEVARERRSRGSGE